MRGEREKRVRSLRQVVCRVATRSDVRPAARAARLGGGQRFAIAPHPKLAHVFADAEWTLPGLAQAEPGGKLPLGSSGFGPGCGPWADSISAGRLGRGRP